MLIGKLFRICCMVTFLAGLAGGSAIAADVSTTLDTSQQAKEMPVLRGDQWQTLSREAKLAFVWGIGHVVTIEEHVIMRHPELARKGFVAKLAEGLRGVPMRDVVDRVDRYYLDNPDDLDLPVMRVIWSQIVKPKLRTGVGDTPLNNENDR